MSFLFFFNRRREYDYRQLLEGQQMIFREIQWVWRTLNVLGQSLFGLQTRQWFVHDSVWNSEWKQAEDNGVEQKPVQGC